MIHLFEVIVYGKNKSDTLWGFSAASNKPNAKGEITIYLVYYVNDEGVPRSTGIRVNIADWDKVKGRVRLKNPNAGRLNDRLKECRDKIDA